jgi:hypothetical protein
MADTPRADVILRQTYDNYGASSEAQVTMTIHRPGWERPMDTKAWTRGTDDALVRFIASPKDSSNATLKLSADS